MSNLGNAIVKIKFNNLALVQWTSSSLYRNFILNLYMAYKLKNWLNNTSNNFTINDCLFNAVKLTTDAVESKFIYNCWEIASDWAGKCSYGDSFAGIVKIFVVDNNSLIQVDIRKDSFLSIRRRSSLSLYYNVDEICKQISLNDNVYNFSIGHRVIEEKVWFIFLTIW